MKPFNINNSSVTLFSLLLGSFLVSCAASTPPLYDLDDPEVFRADRTHPYKLLVLRLADRRPQSELEWENRVTGGQPDFVDRLTERLGRQLGESGLFREVRATLEPVEPGLWRGKPEIAREGFDLVLAGELAHFSGFTDADGNIEGRAALEGLRLFQFQTGEVLWEGTSDKVLKRKEKTTATEFHYASEALRGALNRVSQSLAALESSKLGPGELRSSLGRVVKVGILIPEDRRPEEERDILLRRLKGDPYYSFYAGSSFWAKFLCRTFQKCEIPTEEDMNPLAEQIAGVWVEKVSGLNLFGEVHLIRSQSINPDSLARWRELGYGAVISSRLVHSFGAVTPSSKADWFPVWSGGIANHKKFKAFSVTQINFARLVDTGTGEVIWEGDGEFRFEKPYYSWRIPTDFLWFSIHGALDQLTSALGDSITHQNL